MLVPKARLNETAHVVEAEMISRTAKLKEKIDMGTIEEPLTGNLILFVRSKKTHRMSQMISLRPAVHSSSLHKYRETMYPNFYCKSSKTRSTSLLVSLPCAPPR